MATDADITTPAIGLARTRLAADATVIPDATMTLEATYCLGIVLDRFPCIGGIASVAAPAGTSAVTDGDWIARAVGCLTAARLHSAVEQTRSGGALLKKAGELEIKYQPAQTAAADGWLVEAREALSNISCVKAARLAVANSYQATALVKHARTRYSLPGWGRVMDSLYVAPYAWMDTPVSEVFQGVRKTVSRIVPITEGMAGLSSDRLTLTLDVRDRPIATGSESGVQAVSDQQGSINDTTASGNTGIIARMAGGLTLEIGDSVRFFWETIQ